MTHTSDTNGPARLVPPARTEWPSYTDGNWHRIRNEPYVATGTFGPDNARRCNAARMWAGRHGLRLEYRSLRGGRELWIRFLPKDTPREAAWRRYEHRATGVVES